MRHVLTILIGSWNVLCSILATTPTKGAGECNTELSVDGIQGNVLHDLCSLTSTPGVSLVLTCKDQESFKCLQPIDPIVLDVCQEERQLSKVVAISRSNSKQYGGSLSVELSLMVQDDDVAKVLDVFQVHSSLQSTSEGVTRLEAIGRDRQTRIQLALHRTCISPSMVLLDRSRRENKLRNGPVQISITDRLQSGSAREESVFSGEGEQGSPSFDEVVKDSLHRLQQMMNSIALSHATASDTPGSSSVQTKAATQTTTPSPTLSSTQYLTTSKSQSVSGASSATTSPISKTASVSTVPPTDNKSVADVKGNIELKTDEKTQPLLVQNEDFKWAADEQEPRVIKQINDQDFLDQLLDSLRDGANENPVRGPPAPLAFSKPHVPVPTTTSSTAPPAPPPEPIRTAPISSTIETPSARVVEFNPWSEITKSNSTNSTDDAKISLNTGVGDANTLSPLTGVPTGKPKVNADDATIGSVTVPRPSSTSTPTSSMSQEPPMSQKTDSTLEPGPTDMFVPNNPPVARVTKQAATTDISSKISDTTTVLTSSTTSATSAIDTDNNKSRKLTLHDTTTEFRETANDDIGSQTTTGETEDTATTQTPSTSTIKTSTTPTTTTITTEASTSTPTPTTITTEASKSASTPTTTTKPTATEATTAKELPTTSTERSTETQSTGPTINKSSSNKISSTTATTSALPITPNTTAMKTTSTLKISQTVTPVINSSSTSTKSSASTDPVITTPSDDLSSGHTPGPLLATSSDSKAKGLSISVSGDPENDDTFWPIVAAMVIGIPSIIVFGIAITVIHKRRKIDTSRAFYLGGHHHRHSIDV
ncbi:uncharacterized protein [Haliotis asinina]|uniref:uncharacterized protein n=1 Tax=Haliotis asinina TaxID=109174 RepID=UPI00353194C7